MTALTIFAGVVALAMVIAVIIALIAVIIALCDDETLLR